MKQLQRRSSAMLSQLMVVALVACSRNSTQEAPAESSVEEALQNPADAFPEKPLVPGDQVFDFRALAHNGSAVKLSDFDDAPTLVYFCADVTEPTCEAITLGLRDGWLTLQTQISMVLVVAPQGSVTLADYASLQELPMLLLSDADRKLRRVFGIDAAAAPSFLVSVTREVLHVFANPGGRDHGQEVVNQINQLGLLKPAYPR